MPENLEKSPVGIPSIGYEVMEALWPLIHDLLGGTQAMREASQTWLPMETRESSPSYNARLGRSILYNGYRDTLNKLSTKPFTHPITITDLPAEIAYLEKDVDGNNKPLEIFIREVLVNLIKYGIAHIFVAYSVIEEVVEGKEITKAEEKRLGARVYLLCFSPTDLVGWQTEKNANKTSLVQIRVKETVIEADGDYGDKEVNYINVFSNDTWEIHQQDVENTDKYVKIKDGVSTFGRIPLVTIYANKTGFMTAEPPLIDLAWMNLAHWQSYSDQKNILRFSRFGLIFGKGLPEKMVKAGTLDIGPSTAFLVESESADMKYVEHTGKSMEAGQKDIEDIEYKMRVLGSQPLMKASQNTATAERIDESRTVSQLQSWIGALERGIKQALEFACEWHKTAVPETMSVAIYNDFEAMILGSGDKDHILKARQAGEITRVRYLKEAQRRGVFSIDMDVEEEAKAADAEEVNSLENLLPEEELEPDDEELDVEEE